MNKALFIAKARTFTSFVASDGTRYGRDMYGNWIRFGYQTGMSDEHLREFNMFIESLA